MVAEIAVRFEANDLILTSRNVFLTVEEFLKHYEFRALDTTIFYNPYFAGGSQAVRVSSVSSPSMGKEETAFCYIVPIKANIGSLNCGTAYIFLKREPVLGTLLLNSMNNYGNIVLTDKNGNVLLEQSALSDTNCRENKNTYLELSNTAETLYCKAKIGNEYFNDVLSGYYKQSGLFIILSILTGIAVALLVTVRETAPVSKLVAELSQIGIITEQSENAFDIILDSALQMEAKQNGLEKQAEIYRNTICNSILNQFLYYSKTFTEHDIKNFYDSFPLFPNRYLLCYGNMEYGETLNQQRLAAIETLLSQSIRSEMQENVLFHSIDSNSFVIICPYLETEKVTLDVLSAALAKANSQMNCKINISISQMYDSPIYLPIAFEECRRNLFRNWAQHSNENYENMFTRTNKLQVNDTYELYLSLLDGNEEGCEQIIRFVFCHLEPLHIESEQRYYALRLAIILAQRDSDIDGNAQDLPKYGKITSPNEALDKLLDAGKATCIAIKEKQKNSVSEQGEKFLQYIEQNYSNDMLCPAQIAEHFHLSEKYLYTVFKESTGRSPASYILQKRMKVAAELLLTTDMTVQEISSSVGFNNFSTFHKAFKREYATTPGQFRCRNI